MHLMIRPEDVPPSHPGWEVIGVFNPGVVRFGDQTVILGRVAERPSEQRSGWTAHPRHHGNRSSDIVGEVGAYCAGAMLMAKDDPSRVLKVSRDPILVPEHQFENEGFVNKVVFPTGVVEEHDRLLVYYDASDRYCAMMELSRDDVLHSLK